MFVIAAMTINGILDVQLEHGSVNGDTFLEFMGKCVFPHFMPFNGTNPNSVSILDNCSIHVIF